MVNEKPVGKVIVIIESEDKEYEFSKFDITFDNTPDEIIKAVSPAILEEFGVNIEELYVVQKAENSGNVYIRPKSPAGY